MLSRNDGICYMQDPIHAGLKLRTCFLRTYAALPLGNKLASVAHLKLLIRVPKSIHGLVMSDISPIDRQNWKSWEKCISSRTREALVKYVPESEGTAHFLQLSERITTSLMSHEMTPHERIESIFHAIFFLRIWRKFILNSEFVLKENFITSNAYLCAELNGMNLLKLVRIFRDENKPELFMPTLFDSQACERAFRQFRATGVPNYTKINWTLYDLFHMVRRIEVQNEIVYFKLSNLNIELPILGKKRRTTAIFALPTEDEIKQCLDRATRFAINDAANFGMTVGEDDINTCALPIPKYLEDDLEASLEDDDSEASEVENENNDIDDTETFMNDIMENEFADGEDLQRSMVTVKDHLGRDQVMRKSTFVWTISEGTPRYSSDRRYRVQQNNTPIAATDVSLYLPSTNIVQVEKHIKLGEWCFFKGENEQIVIGSLHAFRYAKRKLVKDKIYKFDSIDLEGRLDLEVLSSWHSLDDKGALNSKFVGFISVRKYIATVSSPTVDPDTRTLFYNENDLKEIDNIILGLVDASK